MINGKKVLIVGGSSLLGKYLLMTSPVGNYVTATWCRNYQEGIDWQMDITDLPSVHYVYDTVRPDFTILCSAIGSVDYCETHYKEAYAVNVEGVQNVIAACKDYHSSLMYVSSNAVFKGDDAPYSEKDEASPVNRYGKMKTMAEQYVLSDLIHRTVIRPIMLYGWPYKGGRGNWITFVTESLRANKDIYIVDDVTTQPTYALHCARIMWHLLDRHIGICHIAGEETMSLWEFARMIAHTWGYDRGLVHSITSNDERLKDMAPRPVNPTYCLDKQHSYNLYASARTIDGLRRVWNE